MVSNFANFSLDSQTLNLEFGQINHKIFFYLMMMMMQQS